MHIKWGTACFHWFYHSVFLWFFLFFFTCLLVSFKSAQRSMYIFTLPSFSKCSSSLCSSRECFWNGQRHFWKASLESSLSALVPGICQCYTCLYHSSPHWMRGWKSKKVSIFYVLCANNLFFCLSFLKSSYLYITFKLFALLIVSDCTYCRSCAELFVCVLFFVLCILLPSGNIVLHDSPPAHLVDVGMSLLSLFISKQYWPWFSMSHGQEVLFYGLGTWKLILYFRLL